MKNLLRSAFNRAPAQKHLSSHQPLIALHLAGRASWTSRDYAALAREGYQKNAIVYRCVRLFAFNMPGDYQGPLIGVGLDPFSISQINGPSAELTIDMPIRMGALLTDLPRGPIGRWSHAVEFEIFLPSVSLYSISDEAVFAGGNRFAIETERGWEIIQASNAELIAPSTYRLSRLLRGQHGSEADMMETVPSGARVLWLGRGLTDMPLSGEYIGEMISLTATAAGRESNPVEFTYAAAHLRPFAPVHVKLRSYNAQSTISWVRQSRIGGDNWAGLEVPLGEETEIYRVQLVTDGTVTAEYEVSSSEITRPEVEILAADYVKIAQGSRAYG